jgi:uncharacterized damage-inducible protein DinB
MNWTALLKAEIEAVYPVAESLIKMVEPNELTWKPEAGSNWMTTGQLLEHMTTACGFCIRGFVTGDWGMPEGVSVEDMDHEDMLPPAEKMPSSEGVEAALSKLAADKATGLAMIDEAGEETLANRMVTAPWNPDTEFVLGHRCLHMIDHLASHKSQLFYYLKLLGKPVHTGSLWGM